MKNKGNEIKNKKFSFWKLLLSVFSILVLPTAIDILSNGIYKMKRKDEDNQYRDEPIIIKNNEEEKNNE